MYLKEELNDEFLSEFQKINVTNEDEMLNILNTLDGIAEIGYQIMKNNENNNYLDDEKKEI